MIIQPSPYGSRPSTSRFSGNLLFTGNREGNVFALDATNGKLLWNLYLGGQVVASPVTYLVNGKQRVTIAVGHTLYTFGLRD